MMSPGNGHLSRSSFRFTDAAATQLGLLSDRNRQRVMQALGMLTQATLADLPTALMVPGDGPIRVVPADRIPASLLSSGSEIFVQMLVQPTIRVLLRVDSKANLDAAATPVDLLAVLRISAPRDALADAVQEALATRRDQTPARVARGATSLAARVAGPQRAHLNQEWRALLAGAPEDGITFSSRRQAVMALQFMAAAVRMRLRDVVRPMWRPVDWVLRTGGRTNGVIAAVVGSQAIYIVGDGGVAALVTEVWEPCGIVGAALYTLSRWLRRVRGIELGAAERGQSDD